MHGGPGDATQKGVSAKRFGRRRAIAAIGAVAASAAVPLRVQKSATRPAGAPPAARTRALRPLAAPGAPRALTHNELDTLGHLVETILPTTDTPGARDAGVHTFLDDVASIETDTRQELQRGVALAHAKAVALHGRAYGSLSPDQQDDVMQALSEGAPNERAFFAWLKRHVVDAYYRSEIGQIGELQWVGHEFHTTFPGACGHRDPLKHTRESWPRASSAEQP
jgi:hypothetical protein